MSSAGTIEREKPVFDVATMSTADWYEVWPDLKRWILDPCSTALIEGIEAHYDTDDAKSERYRRRKAQGELAAEMRLESPR